MPGPGPRLLPPALALAAAVSAVLFWPTLQPRIEAAFGGAAAGRIAAVPNAAAWLAAAWFGARLVDAGIARAARQGHAGPAPRLLADLAYAFLFGLAGLQILGFVLERSVTGLVATSGVLIAVLGFAVRNMIADMVSGIALNVEHPYRIGDWIEVGPGLNGRVEEINWRETRLATNDGTMLIVPNGLVAGSRFVNYSRPSPRLRSHIRITLDAAVPVERAKRVLGGALHCAEGILSDPAPDVVVEAITERGVTYLARYWVPDFGRDAACRDAVASAVLGHLARTGLEVARPVQELVRPRREPPGRQPACRALLAGIDLFSAFDPPELDTLAAAMKPLRIPPGGIVVRQDAPGDSLFVVAEGAFDVAARTTEGRVIRLDRMGAGAVFGEMSLLTGQPRSATVSAATDALVYELDKAVLDPLLKRRPELAASLAGLMVERRRHNQDLRLADTMPEERPATADDLLTRLLGFFRM